MPSSQPASDPSRPRRPLPSRLFDRLDTILVGTAGIVLAGIVVLMNVEVAGRSLFGRSTQMADEFAGYGLCAVTMLCLVAAMRRDRFIRVEGLVERLPRMGRMVCDVFGAAIGLGVSLVLCFATAKVAWTSYEFGTRSIEVSQTPLFLPQMAMPFGFGLLALAFVETAIRKVRLNRAGPEAGPR
jgi:TRAP-type C4-dicarboxylate transport system permease small subunit